MPNVTQSCADFGMSRYRSIERDSLALQESCNLGHDVTVERLSLLEYPSVARPSVPLFHLETADSVLDEILRPERENERSESVSHA